MTEPIAQLNHFVRISRRVGARFDLVQAGGGNTSVKIGDDMIIKASGRRLADITTDSGHVTVPHRQIARWLDSIADNPPTPNDLNAVAEQQLSRQNAAPARPSIETFMHCILGPFVIHTHPVSVNIAACQPGAADVFQSLFPGSFVVDYDTPGASLALRIRETLKKNAVDNNQTLAIFLRNHGLIVSAPDPDAAMRATDDVSLRLEQHFELDLAPWRIAPLIADLINPIREPLSLCVPCRDADILDILRANPANLFAPAFCPDDTVYLGGPPLVLENLADPAPVLAHINQHNETPRVILHAGLPYIYASSFRKTADIEAMLKFRLMVLHRAGDHIQFLSRDEIRRLQNWDAEKRRREL